MEILLVDDCREICDWYRGEFARAGHPCVSALNVHEALERLSEHPRIRVAVLDYRIPGFTARELVDSLRAARPDLLLVGHSVENRSDAFAALGVGRFLMKPWDVDDLLKLVALPTNVG